MIRALALAAALAAAGAGAALADNPLCPFCSRGVSPEWSYCPFDGTRLKKLSTGDVMTENSIATIRLDPPKYAGRSIVLAKLKVLSVNRNNAEYPEHISLYLGCDVMQADKRLDSATVLVPKDLAEAAAKLTAEKLVRVTGTFRGADTDYGASLLVEATALEDPK